MKTIKSFLKCYFIGVIFSALLVLTMYVYDYVMLGYWKYALTSNFVFSCFVAGVPFAIGVFYFSKVLSKQ